jgi:hypothetical protein
MQLQVTLLPERLGSGPTVPYHMSARGVLITFGVAGHLSNVASPAVPAIMNKRISSRGRGWVTGACCLRQHFPPPNYLSTVPVHGTIEANQPTRLLYNSAAILKLLSLAHRKPEWE